MKHALTIQTPYHDETIPTDTQLITWLNHALAFAPHAVSLTLRIVDRAESAELNQAYRYKQGPTNVLSFSYDTQAIELTSINEEPPLLGDIVICAPVVAKEALAQNKTLAAHWAHLLIHGVLHLLGFDHQKDLEAEKMEAKEVELLTALGFANPYLQACSND